MLEGGIPFHNNHSRRVIEEMGIVGIVGGVDNGENGSDGGGCDRYNACVFTLLRVLRPPRLLSNCPCHHH